METLAAIGGFVLIVILLAVVYAKSEAKAAKEQERRKTLQQGAEVRDAIDKVLAKPVPLGDDMRSGWRRLRDGKRK